MKRIGTTDLEVFPLALGGNVFGWSADEAQSFAVLDAYVERGGNFVDTADVYSAWADGHSGGESETIIGKWMRVRKNRNALVIGTKVGKAPGLTGLAPATIRRAAEASLRRLGIDTIDLYYAHADDPGTPLEETLRAFDELVRAGKVRYIAASQYTAPRLAEAIEVSKRNALPRYVALQTQYSLVHRQDFEGELAALCVREDVAYLPFWVLASGFLTGKYRPGKAVASVRAEGMDEYFDARGLRVLAALDAISAAHHSSQAAVAIAWAAAQKGVTVPLASARTVAQLEDLFAFLSLELTAEDVARLTEASAS